MVLAMMVVVVAVSALPIAARWAFERLGIPSPALPPGTPPISPLAVWIAVAAHIPAVLVVRRAMRRRELAWIAVAISTFPQLAWIQLVAWYALPYVPLIAMSLLFAMWFAISYNDALILYDATPIKLIHGLGVPLFDAALLLVDLTGGRGLVHAYRLSPASIANFLVFQLVLVAIDQAIFAAVGKQAREVDGRMQEQSALLAERALFQRVAGVLGLGLKAGRFSHDIVGPVSTLTGQIEVVEEALRAAKHDDPLLAEDARESLAEMRVAAHRILDMSGLLAHSVHGKDEPIEIATLISRAQDELRVALAGHRVEAAPVEVDATPGTVHATDAHVAALANLLTNAVLQAPASAVELRGRPVSPWFYVLEIRDHGTAPEERAERLARVLACLKLEPEARGPSSEPPRYRGYGVGLMMAKLVAMRHRGWIDAAAPPEGRGIAVRIALTRVSPELLPADADERAAAAGGTPKG
jgi:signal transduction histidine kinase